jgi:hypothetical protein
MVFEENCMIDPEPHHIENTAHNSWRPKVEKAGAQVEPTFLVQRRISFGSNQSHLKIFG